MQVRPLGRFDRRLCCRTRMVVSTGDIARATDACGAAYLRQVALRIKRPLQVNRRTRWLMISLETRTEHFDAVTATLKRDGIWLNHHRALASCLSMIFSENRCTLFRIMP